MNRWSRASFSSRASGTLCRISKRLSVASSIDRPCTKLKAPGSMEDLAFHTKEKEWLRFRNQHRDWQVREDISHCELLCIAPAIGR
jgi:hypothetical protein